LRKDFFYPSLLAGEKIFGWITRVRLPMWPEWAEGRSRPGETAVDCGLQSKATMSRTLTFQTVQVEGTKVIFGAPGEVGHHGATFGSVLAAALGAMHLKCSLRTLDGQITQP
jgi:hypothetical protein